MNRGESLKVSARAPFSARVWNALATAVTALRLIAGPGIRLRTIPGIGTIISVIARAGFVHPWKTALTTGGARIRPGLVNGVLPTIQGVPMDGGDSGAPPSLLWDRLALDASGLGWIAVEITCDKDWAVQSAQCVQVATLDTADGQPPKAGASPGFSAGGIPGLPGRKARYPLAMLRQRKSGLVAVFQVPYFNLQHRVAVTDAKTDVARHFFF